MRTPKLKSWLLLVGGFTCSCSADPSPAPRSPLTLYVKTNARITKDLDQAWVTIKQDGAEVYHWRVDLDPQAGTATLPLEVELIPGGAKAPYIEFLVEARRNGATVGQWRHGVLLPNDAGKVLDTQLKNERDARALAEAPMPQATTAEAEPYDAPVEPARARLDIEIDGLCLASRAGCPDTQTCVRGRCVESELKFEELPLLRASQVLPSKQDVPAPCVDVEKCFAASEELTPLEEPCAFAAPAGGGTLSIAAQLKGSEVGYCDSGVCLLPLEPGPDQDWTESGSITLEPELCEGGLVERFVATRGCGIAMTSSFCATHVPTSGMGGAGGAPPDTGGQAGTGGDAAPNGPRVLASGRDAPGTIAVNARGVFWLELARVMRVDHDGGTPSELAAGDFVARPTSLTISDSTLYYVNGTAGGTSGVMSVPLDRRADPTRFAPAQGGQTWGVMASGGLVYWTTTLGSPSILRVPEAGTSTPEVFHTASDSPRIYECVADAQNLYWGDAMGAIFKQGLTDGESTWLRDPALGATEAVVRLAVANGSVYWTTGNPSPPSSPTPGKGALYKVPIEGGDVTSIASGDSVTAAVAADDAGVYYCDGALKRLPHDGGSAQVIAEGQQAAAIALDQTYVYWTDATAGTVMRALK